MKSGKVANHPLVVVEFPVKRRAPLFTIHRFPAFGKPPAKILIAIVANELKKIAIAHQRAVDTEILQEDLMRRLFIVESEVVVRRTLDFGLWTLDLVSVAKPKQSACNLCHALDPCHGGGSGLNRRVELIAQQMLDVVNEQFLMLHLVLESEPH